MLCAANERARPVVAGPLSSVALRPGAQRPAVEDGLDGRLGYEECLGPPFGDTTFTGERAVVPGQHDPENEDRKQAHERVRSEAAPERAGWSRGGLHQ